MSPADSLPPDPRLQFERTSCACPSCVVACRHMPGGLIPGDAERMVRTLSAEDFDAWALECLEASQGAAVPHEGRLIRLPTIVPRTNAQGGCVFLADARCTVHEVSPFGCAYLDMHMSPVEVTRRSAGALLAVANDWARKGPYSQLWARLFTAGNVAASLEERQANMHQALAAIDFRKDCLAGGSTS